MNTRPFKLLPAVLIACALNAPNLRGQDDAAAKASIIQGIEAFRAGDSNADSLFAMGESQLEGHFNVQLRKQATQHC